MPVWFVLTYFGVVSGLHGPMTAEACAQRVDETLRGYAIALGRPGSTLQGRPATPADVGADCRRGAPPAIVIPDHE